MKPQLLNYLIFSILLAIPVVTKAQDNIPFDKAFLESLPNEMRAEVMNQIDDKGKKTEEVYQRPSSKIEKEYQSKEIKDYIDYLEKKYQLPSSDFKSKRFGVALFNSMQTSFMPLNEPNLDADYVLDFGDVLEVQVLSAKSYTEQVEVKRDGSISLKEIGKIFVGGLSLGKADDLIKAKVSSAYLGKQAFTSVVNVRDIQVYVMGEAENPGLYTLSGNSNVLNALYIAAGIKESGSFRNILLKRAGKVISSIDLYELFINGNSAFGTRLRSGDVVLIPSTLNTAAIYGGVKRPFEYEFKDGETVMDLISFANGLTSSANKKTIKRIANNGDSTLLSFDNLDKIKLGEKDSLFIANSLYKNVSIEGAVKFPGEYILEINDKLSDLILKAGGYREDAYPFGGILENKTAGKISYDASNMAHKKLLETFFQNGVNVTQGLVPILEELKQVPSNRVIATFDIDEIQADPTKDTFLHDDDRITIPVQTQQIFVFGAVNSPGATRFNVKNNIKDYIDDKGGFAQGAMKNLIFVVSPNGESSLYTGKNIFGVGRVGEVTHPGSFIFVTPKMKMAAGQTASVWAPVVSGFALAAASLSSISN
jgi:polysaccharide biosynthesis/export protein